MFLLLGVIIVCVLGALALMRPSGQSNQQVNVGSLMPSAFARPESHRPEASPWSRQVAVDMLNEVVVADERDKVINMLRRAVKTPEVTAPSATTGSSSAAKQPIA